MSSIHLSTVNILRINFSKPIEQIFSINTLMKGIYHLNKSKEGTFKLNQ
jgi:hypothetical protein